MCIDDEFYAHRDALLHAEQLRALNQNLCGPTRADNPQTNTPTYEIGVLYDAHPRMKPALMCGLYSLDMELEAVREDTRAAGREPSPSMSYRIFVIDENDLA